MYPIQFPNRKISHLSLAVAILVLLAMPVFGQVKNTKKPVVSISANAEKAWIPFWKNFLEVIKNRDSQGLSETMSENFEYGFGIYKRKSLIKMPEFDLSNKNASFWESLERITSKGVTNLLKKNAEIACYGKNARTISKVSPDNWNNIADGESENSNMLVFEFRGNRWFFVAFDDCEIE